MNWKKIGTGLVLGIVYSGILMVPLCTGGCATQSPLFSTRANKASVIVEKPPLRVILSGEYSAIDADSVIRVLKELRYHKYHNYRFTDSISIDSNHATTNVEQHDIKHNMQYKRKK